ncbi:MAG: hypothetical protein K2L59_06335 [Muribaculaceae bacterium]|nr:hypothetical protein [Muribaculaceae bacterium]
MTYSIDEIGERVYALLDENRTIMTERVEYCDPGASPDTLITMLLPDVAREVLTSASLEMLDECRTLRSAAVSRNAETGVVTCVLPSDCLRVIYLRMDDWATGIDALLDTSGYEYRLRFSDGVRGTRRRSRPGAAVRRKGAVRILEIFGSEAGKVAELDYVAVPVITDGKTDLPPGVFSEVCSRLAARIKEITAK